MPRRYRRPKRRELREFQGLENPSIIFFKAGKIPRG